MTAEEIRSGIMGYIATNWTVTSIEYTNQNFDNNSLEAWIRPTILLGDSFIGELGTIGIGEGTGVLMISIFVSLGTGVKVANDYADNLATLFRRTEGVTGLIFDEPSIYNVGKETEKNLFHVMFRIPFHFFIGE
ncbi:MAG: phage tail terminator-like protein [Bacteroidota bacterium]